MESMDGGNNPSAAGQPLVNAPPTFPGRAEQIDALTALMGQPTEPSPPCIFVTGVTATGKTCVLRHLFSTSVYPHPRRVAWLNCVDRHSTRLLFESALNQLAGVEPQRTDDGNSFIGLARCDNISDFVANLGQVCKKVDEEEGVPVGWGPTRYLIFDKAERLRNFSPTLIPTLMKLPELTRQNITTIFISSIAWDDFRCRAGSMDPVVVHFPQYTKPDVLKIISRDCPPDEEMPFFLSFVDLVYGVFYKPCRDLNELRHLVALLFPKYVEPVLAGKVTRQQTAKLFQHIQHHMKEALHSLYLREISSSEWLKKSEAKSKFLDVSRKWTQEVDLPYYTKFLLIASFLASYNPPRLDVRFFSRGGEERKKRKGGRGKVPKSEGGGKMRQQLLGPKAFPVERMLAIFYSIVETDVDCSVDIQTQITSLISLRLLARVTSVDRLDSVKCKCNVSFEFIEKVGRSVRFNVSKYLHDFM